MKKIFFVLGLWSLVSLALAQAPHLQLYPQNISGTFVLKNIMPLQPQGFSLDFAQVVEKNGASQAARLRLDVNEVYHSLSIADSYDLEATIIGLNRKGILMAAQITIFISTAEGKTPVTLLSQKYPVPLSLKGSSFIKFHAPQSDFRVF